MYCTFGNPQALQLVPGPPRGVSFDKERWKNQTNVSYYSFRVTLGEERLRIQVSNGDTCSGRDTYHPNPVDYPLMPCNVTEQKLRKYLRTIMRLLRT